MMLPYLIGGISIVALLLYALWRVVDMLDTDVTDDPYL